MTESARTIDVTAAEQAAEEINTRHRRLSRPWQTVIAAFTVVSIFLAANQLFNLGFFIGHVMVYSRYLYMIAGLMFSMVFVVFPASAGSPRERVPWYDIALFALSLALTAYFVYWAELILDEAWEYGAPDHGVYVAVVMWALILEAGRRAGGTAIFVIVLVISLYPTYADMMPQVISGVGQTFLDTAAFHMFSEESLLGIPMRAFALLVFGFLLFGVALQHTGAGKFFINLAFALLGHVRGGPAKVAIFSSGLMGSMSGSVVTNVLTTGTLSIPAMKRTGFSARYAGGVEACASTGGVLMPPIMGATAFVMATFLNVRYIDVAMAAVIPSLMYFFGLFMQIDSYSAHQGLKGLPREELPKIRQVLIDGWIYIAVFAFLIWMLVFLQQESTAPFYATALLLAINQISKKHRLNKQSFFKLIQATGMLLAELAGVLAAIGLIVGSLTVTGMAGSLTNDLVYIAGSNPLLLLIMGAVTSFILGIGMTVTAAYIFLAIVLAPALIKVGLDPMGVHMFMLYWGMLSFITPPVALGAFAAATVAKSKPMETGLEAMRLGAIIYFIPFFFVFNPALLMRAPLSEILIVGAGAAVGVILLAGALQGHLLAVGPLGRGPLGWLARALVMVGGLTLAAPGGGMIGWSHIELNLLALALVVPGVALAVLVRRRTAPAPG